MNNKFDLIIFDCDGTLTDSEQVNSAALLDVLHESGFTQYDLQHAYKHWIGTTIKTTMLKIQTETGRMPPEDTVPRYIARVAELQKTSLRPVEGATELVAAVKDKYKICVASNGERVNVIASLEMTGLMDFFTVDTVFTKVQVDRPKPYPDLFLFAAEKMGGIDPARCLVIEDSTAGVTAGHAAGMTTWGFTGSSHDPENQDEYLRSAGANEVFPLLIHMQKRLTP